MSFNNCAIIQLFMQILITAEVSMVFGGNNLVIGNCCELILLSKFMNTLIVKQEDSMIFVFLKKNSNPSCEKTHKS